MKAIDIITEWNDKSPEQQLDYCKWNIRLPYSGELPCYYDRAEISFVVRPDYADLTLFVYYDEYEHDTFTVEAEWDEINEIMGRFFFHKKRPNRYTYYTRTDNGLTKYWNAYMQAEYQMWEEYTRDELKLIAVARQLDAAQRDSLIRELQRLA